MNKIEHTYTFIVIDLQSRFSQTVLLKKSCGSTE